MQIVMELLIRMNCPDCRDSRGVHPLKPGKLMFKVTKYDAFNRNRGGDDGLAPEEACHDAEEEAAKRTEVVAAATGLSATGQLSLENRPMTALVLPEVDQCRNEVPGCEPRQQYLASVDADSTVLTGMIDLDDAGARVRVNLW